MNSLGLAASNPISLPRLPSASPRRESLHPRGLDVELTERQRGWFWSHVRVNERTGCWEWTGGHDKDGYGYFLVRPRLKGLDRTHRVSWVIHFGPIPVGLFVLHRCDNPPCVRPDHLWLGTSADNTADMVAKGRESHHRHFGGAVGHRNGHYTHPESTARGERHGSRTHPEAVLRGAANGMATTTEAQVREVRRLRATGELYRDIAEAVGLKLSNVQQIARRKTWRHILP